MISLFSVEETERTEEQRYEVAQSHTASGSWRGEVNSGGRLAPEPTLLIATPYLLCHHEKMGTQGPREVSERESSIMSNALRKVQIGKETY